MVVVTYKNSKGEIERYGGHEELSPEQKAMFEEAKKNLPKVLEEAERKIQDCKKDGHKGPVFMSIVAHPIYNYLVGMYLCNHCHGQFYLPLTKEQGEARDRFWDNLRRPIDI